MENVYRYIQMSIDIYKCIQIYTNVYRYIQMSLDVFSSERRIEAMRVEEMAKVELSQNVYAHTHTYMFYMNQRGEWKCCQLRR